MKKSLLVVSSALVAESQAAINAGPCLSNPVAVGNFDVEKYKGLWYEIVFDKEVWYEQETECVTAYYTSRPKELEFKVGVNNGSVNKKTGKLGNGYTSGEPGVDSTVSAAKCDKEGKCAV